jgi:hypothetical protein
MITLRKALFMGLGFIALVTIVAACDNQATSSASCAYLAGDGQSGRDSLVHRVIWPGQKVRVETGEKLTYVQCNSRNFLITDGTVRDANGETIGDRQQPVKATTTSGVPIEVGVTAYWTLNQSEEAMRHFYDVCFKFNCASTNDISGETNNATPGWNDLLGENFGPALERSVRLAAFETDDSIWRSNDPLQFQALADKTSAFFADEVRKTLGYPEDLFCGSGNSNWDDPSKPGEGTFTCSPVRIVTDFVRRGKISSDESTEGAKTINQQRLENAQALYGLNAGYWLALQDTVEKCRSSAGTTCIFNVGESADQAFQVPVTGLTPEPEPEPEPSPTS